VSDIPSLVFEQAPPVPDTFNVLLYGPPGSGKSTAAATAPGPILWLNCQGRGALAYARRRAIELGTEIGEVRVDRSVPNVKNLLSHVMDHVRTGADPVPATVVIDTLGDLRALLIDQIVVPGAKNSIQQFGEVAKTIKDTVIWFRDRPVNLVILCHEDVADVEGDRIVRPLIGGALTEQIPAEVDVMAYTGVVRDDDRVRYLGQLVEGRGRRAKDRSGGLGDVRDLNLTDWLSAYRAALTPDGSDVPWVDPAADAEVELEASE
jgi:hypothetical protein